MAIESYGQGIEEETKRKYNVNLFSCSSVMDPYARHLDLVSRTGRITKKEKVREC